MGVPNLNARKNASEWNRDREISEAEIKQWLAAYRFGGDDRDSLESQARSRLSELSSKEAAVQVARESPSVLKDLRSLTRRNIGTAQASQFIGVSTTRYENLESGKKWDKSIAEGVVDLIWNELDEELVPWLISGGPRSAALFDRAIAIAVDRQMVRAASTALRYEHEPRQLQKLETYLNGKGMREVKAGPVQDPRLDVEPGTYSFRRSVTGRLPNGEPLSQSVDALFKPPSWTVHDLPIFMEAKSMTDVVNPNKRQKEEAQKTTALKAAFGNDQGEVIFLILLGGTVPERYLEVEKASGIDWVWEHRLSDLDVLMEWQP